MSRRGGDAGFSLIEVLAALVVLSVAIIGLSHAGTESARAVNALNQKMLAGIVADNQLVLARQGPLTLGASSGQETQLARLFDYELETLKTDTAGFFKITVKVRAADQAQVLVDRAAFRGGNPS